MYIVMGATGHVGGAVARTLIDAGCDVTVITRNAKNAKGLEGARVVELDAHDPSALRGALHEAKRAFLLNPPAPPSTDTDKEERETVRAMLSAVHGSGLEAIVAESTYGAQPGDHVGDASVLYALEQGLHMQSIPTTLVRGAYYMSNLDALLKPAREEGIVPTMMPADLVLPMVAPHDIGHAAAQLLIDPSGRRLVHVEGPERYTFADVARAFSNALGREVKPVVTPRSEWEAAFRAQGFSAEAAYAYARMTAVAVDGPELPSDPIRGGTTLQAYVDALVA